MTDICLGFEVHQPIRLNREFNRDFGKGRSLDELFDIYFNNAWNKEILKRVSKKCYIPANDVILENVDRYRKDKKKFKAAYSVSGVLMEQLERWVPDVLESFKQLAESGLVEFLDQTYYHSLASLFPNRSEFLKQVRLHRELMKDLLMIEPKTFENTEFIYNNSVAKVISDAGYSAIFTEGHERALGSRSPNHVYKAKDCDLKVLFRNYKITDDVGFRFSARWWSEFPLTAEKYSAWLAAMQGDCINIFMDYETIGEHQWKDTGIFEFFSWLPREILKYDNLGFSTPSEIAATYEAKDEIDIDDFSTVSWADIERDTGAWLSNDMQRTCFNAVKDMQPHILKTENKKILELWRLLQISDHFYYMFIAGGGPGVVHGYFSQQPPNDVFHIFTAILSDFQERISGELSGSAKSSAVLLRIIPPQRAMHYYEDGSYVGLSAHGLKELRDTIMLVSTDCIRFLTMNDDFENWIRFTVGDEKLADQVKSLKSRSLSPKNLQRSLNEIVEKRVEELSPE
ncbi:MAG: alpha-amylase [Candidatus Hydrothermarchaeales archaeon]